MNNRIINGILFVILVVVLAIGFMPPSWKQALRHPFQRESSLGSSKGNPNATPPEFATVTGVVDAITIKIDSGQAIRYLGVRAPSSADVVECFGREALQANESVIGKKVRLEKDPVLDRTQDGAWARYVYLQLSPEDIAREQQPTPTPNPSESVSPSVSPSPTPPPPTEIFINQRILEGGFGFPVVSQDMKYGEQLLSDAKYASGTGKGLWGQCKVEADPGGQLQTESVTQCVIKGKVTSDLQKIYRTPQCSAYGQTTVLQSQGDKWFCAEDIAVDAGFTKASDCPAVSDSVTPSPVSVQ